MLLRTVLLILISISSVYCIPIFENKLKYGKLQAYDQIQIIRTEWQIDSFPRFLKSCQMHKVSWDMMRLRFMEIILRSYIHPHMASSFIISFLGSSVTAGQDIDIKLAYPYIIEEYLRPLFDILGIRYEIRSLGFTNSACMPFNSCVSSLAGYDVDMILSEHSYDCFDETMYEQLARQASFLPKKPLIAFVESATSNWYVALGDIGLD